MNPKHKLALDICIAQGLTERNLENVYVQMWRNIRPEGGMRLTNQGHEWLRELGIKPYIINLTDETIQSGSILLGLDRYLKAPYHLKGKRLSIFDSNFSTQLLLYGGDLKAYLDATSHL